MSEQPRRRVAGKVAATLALLAVATGLVAVASLALFTDTASVPGNAFTTGTVDISTSPTSAVVTMPAMAPGDQVTAPLTVNNLGTLDLRYAVISETTEDTLAAELVLTIKSGVASCTNANWTASGTQLYSGGLGSTGGGVPIIGSNAQGADAGDRSLAAGANEVLCFNVTFPLSGTTSGASTTATFTFDAEQIDNNP